MSKTVRPEPAWAAPFIEALAATGNARQAARDAGIGHHAPYYRRKTDPRFAEQWSDALARAKGAKEAKEVSSKPEPPVTGPPVRNWRDRFFAELANTSNVIASAAVANISLRQIYRHRREDPTFAARWLAALHEGYELLEMELLGYLRDPRPGRRMDVGGALRVLNAHRTAVERRRLMNDEEDVDAVRASIDAFLEGMRERRLANEAVLIEAGGEHVAR